MEDWWSVHRAHTTAILAVRRSDVAALNDMVRARRQAAGELGAEIRIGAKAFSVGDRVIFEKNQRVRSADPVDSSSRPELAQAPQRHVRHRGGAQRHWQRCDQGG